MPARLLNILPRLVLLTGLTIACCADIPEAADEYPWNHEIALKYSDLVVRGIIVGYDTKIVAYKEFNPGTKHQNSPLPITVLKIRVLEVMKGTWSDFELSVIAPGGYPDGIPNDSGVIVFIHGHTYNYRIEDEVILALNYSESMRGGSFVVGPDQKRFIRTEFGFENQRDNNIVLAIDEIRSITESTRLNVVYEEADLVVTGTVVGIEGEAPRRKPEKKEFTLKLEDVWKGTYENKTLKFAAITRGQYDHVKKTIVPDILEGEKWVVFLKRDSEEYYPFAGSNGLLKIEGEKLIRNNRVTLDASKSELKNNLVGERENE